MSIRLMRFLDYWLGVPLCFVLSGVNNLAKMFGAGGRPLNSAPRKILCIKLTEIGAIVVSYPLLKRLKKEFPASELFFLTFAKNKEVFAFFDGIIAERNIICIRPHSLFTLIRDTFRAIRRIRKEKIDTVFDLEFFSRFTSVLSSLSGADKKIGFYGYNFEGLYRGNFLTHRIHYNPLLHMSRMYLSFCQPVNLAQKLTPELGPYKGAEDCLVPSFSSTKEISLRVRNKLQGLGLRENNRIFLLNPGEGVLPIREWPLENFVALSKLILEDTRNFIVLVGVRESSLKASLLGDALMSKRCCNLIGETSMRELLELCLMASALICNDSGLAHLASFTPVKKFVFFGAESPRIFAPLGENNFIFYSGLACSPCLSAFNLRRSNCRDNRCLKSIDPEEAHAFIMHKL